MTVSALAAAGLMALGSAPAIAATTCTFTTAGTTMTLDADRTTDETIFLPDGYTLNGGGNTITVIDPAGGHFHGAVVGNAGSVAHVTRLTVAASGLVNACHGGADRLRGIMFEGASGSITKTTVANTNRGASGCQEGNAIEIRNAPFNGSHPDTQTVEIAHNSLSGWQKTGIVANGDVDVWIHHNMVGASATQANLAANSIQVGFGGTGVVEHNLINGNQWLGASAYAATAVLIYLTEDTVVSNNNISGNSDIGIYELGTRSVIDNNRVFDTGQDSGAHPWDIGIGGWGTDPNITNNKVRGFDDALDPPSLVAKGKGGNKAIKGGGGKRPTPQCFAPDASSQSC